MSDEEILRILEEYGKDADWFDEHYEELKKKYRDFIIAIKGRRVVAYGKSLSELIKKVEDAGLDPAYVYIAGFPPEGVGYIL